MKIWLVQQGMMHIRNSGFFIKEEKAKAYAKKIIKDMEKAGWNNFREIIKDRDWMGTRSDMSTKYSVTIMEVEVVK